MVASSSAAPPSHRDLEEELIDYGVRLFTLPSSNDELLSILDKVESLLVRVGQAPSETMRNALHPIMKALIGSELLGHSDEGVKVSVVLCLSEIMRITAPQQPYDDAVMKEIFQHIVGEFEKLSDVKSHCYSKAVQVLDNVSKVRACVLLLDLECDALVIDIIKLFLRIISSSHANDVFTNMEDIMFWIIKECDEVSGELLMPLLDSIKNENQTVSPVSWQLGRNVLEKCSAIVRPYVVQAVKSMSLDIDGYAGILASIYEMPAGEDTMENDNNGPLAACHVEVVSSVQLPPVLQQDATPTSIDTNNQNPECGNSSKTSQNCHQIENLKDTDRPTDPENHSLEDTQPRTDASGLPKRRGRKSLRKCDDDYDHCKVKEDGKQTASVMLSPESVHPVSTSSKDTGNNDGSFRKRGRPKKNQMEGSEGTSAKAKPKRGSRKKEPIVQYNADKSLVVIKKEVEIHTEDMSLAHQNDKDTFCNEEDTEMTAVTKTGYGEELVGAKIRVWWPLDELFYEGEVTSFDRVKKKHKVVYTDGEDETLNLDEERWEMVKEIPPNEDHEADPPAALSAKDGEKKRKGDSSRKQKSATKRPRCKVQGCSNVTVKTPKSDNFWVVAKANENTTKQSGQPSNNENNTPLEEETQAPMQPTATLNQCEIPKTMTEGN